MGPSEGNWRDVTITSKDNLDLESTEYFECMLVSLECSELTCVTPTDYSMVIFGALEVGLCDTHRYTWITQITVW